MGLQEQLGLGPAPFLRKHFQIEVVGFPHHHHQETDALEEVGAADRDTRQEGDPQGALGRPPLIPRGAPMPVLLASWDTRWPRYTS